MLLFSCNQKKEMVYSFPSLFVIQKGSSDRLSVESDELITPFNTYFQTSLYCYEGDYSSSQIDKMKEDYQEKICYYHALSDRHYYYDYDEKRINNIKVINDSYGKEEWIQLDPYLYDLLKRSYQFSIDSDGKFNIFLGEINDVYEKKLSEIHSSLNVSDEDKKLMDVTGLYFSSFTEEEKDDIKKYVSYLPSLEEMKSMLSFDDDTNQVIFHALYDSDGKQKKIQISLGGSAKGYATEYYTSELKKEYPDICLIMNSGTSSIKATAKRVDGKNFKIRYINPAYQEQIDALNSKYVDYEVMLSLSGPFSLSTSGFYENYFYENQDGDFIRRSHILDSATGYSSSCFDQVGIVGDDAFLSDMYTTALMNCHSLDEAKSLLDGLNGIYDTEYKAIFCVRMEDNGLYSFSKDKYSPLDEKNDFIFSDGKPVTKLTGQFKEVYYVDDDLYESFSLIESKTNKTRISEIRKI